MPVINDFGNFNLFILHLFPVIGRVLRPGVVKVSSPQKALSEVAPDTQQNGQSTGSVIF